MNAEDNKPQTLERASKDEQQYEVSPEVPPHHDEPVHSDECGEQAQAGAGGSHGLPRSLLTQVVDGGHVDRAIVSQIPHSECMIVCKNCVHGLNRS